MRIRKKKWAQGELDACNFYVNNPAELKGKWADFFAVKRPLELEVGCGKGTFVAEKALRNPDINFIAMDIKSDMLGVGRRNIVKRFEESGRTVDNIALVAHNVDRIFEVISEDDKIDRIYINFCNPWPRGKHNKRRLTHNTKLELYKSFLKKGGEIHFKTDNDELFEDSLVYFEECGYELKKVVRDLHHSDVEGNIVTEHEKMFSEEGILIKYLVAVLP